jgi:hypothetical protein
MRTQPAVLMLKNDGWPVTAKARIAPRQMSARLDPIFIVCPFLAALAPPYEGVRGL